MLVCFHHIQNVTEIASGLNQGFPCTLIRAINFSPQDAYSRIHHIAGRFHSAVINVFFNFLPRYHLTFAQCQVFQQGKFPGREIERMSFAILATTRSISRSISCNLSPPALHRFWCLRWSAISLSLTAMRLKISRYTVKFHVAAILAKLGATSRTEAVTLGVRHGLISL